MTTLTHRKPRLDDPRLGRVAPSDWTHVEKYPLRGLAPADQPACVPVVLSVNWYAAFDRPERGASRLVVDRPRRPRGPFAAGMRSAPSSAAAATPAGGTPSTTSGSRAHASDSRGRGP